MLKQAQAGTPVPELCRTHGISSATFYKWRSKFGGMDASMMSRLKELEDENRRLKKMYAEKIVRIVRSSASPYRWLSMNPISILLLGLAMSTDAFAAALGKGAGMVKLRLKDALHVGLVFGVVEAITPVVGWLLDSAVSRFIRAWDHWIAFGLLVALEMHMIYKAVAADEDGPAESTPAAA